MPAFGLRCQGAASIESDPASAKFCGGNERPDGWFLPLSRQLNWIPFCKGARSSRLN